jgi:hypothetical protein
MELSTYIDKEGLLRVTNNRYQDTNIVFPNKGKLINTALPIRVYRNLHKNMYSIQQGGLVVAYAERLCVRDFKTIVGKKSRDRVLKEKSKNVHAFIEGYYETSGMGTSAAKNDLPAIIRYDPYKFDFFYLDNLTLDVLEVKGGKFCILDKTIIRGEYLITSNKINE